MIEIRQSVYADIKNLCLTLREKDKQESLKLGYNPRLALRYSYKNAIYRKTLLINKQVCAMWGVGGSVLSEIGYPYLMTGEFVNDIRHLTLVRIYKDQVSEMNNLFSNLVGYADSEYLEAIKLLKLAGFLIEPAAISGFMKYTMTKESS